jgi:hypothetical protein
MKVGDRVRKARHMDGSCRVVPMGPILTIVEIKDHKCIDGVGGKDEMIILSDGTWAFPWNLLQEEGERNEGK